MIAVLSTGDEVGSCASGAPTPTTTTTATKIVQGRVLIHDANRPMLIAALRAAGTVAGVVDLGHVGDTAGALRAAVEAGLRRRDVDALVMTGGVSMGARDLAKDVLEELGSVHFGRLRMSPGKPTTFATVPPLPAANAGGGAAANGGVEAGDDVAVGGQNHPRTKVVFALPGNPVSALVTCNLLVGPAVRRMAGYAPAQCHSPRIVVELAHAFRLDAVRNEYHRARLAWSAPSARFQVRGVAVKKKDCTCWAGGWGRASSSLWCRRRALVHERGHACFLPCLFGFVKRLDMFAAWRHGVACAPGDGHGECNAMQFGGLLDCSQACVGSPISFGWHDARTRTPAPFVSSTTLSTTPAPPHPPPTPPPTPPRPPPPPSGHQHRLAAQLHIVFDCWSPSPAVPPARDGDHARVACGSTRARHPAQRHRVVAQPVPIPWRAAAR